MAATPLTHLLDQLEQTKTHYTRAESARVEKLLNALAKHRFPDAQSLIRFHESLLFLRAFPQSQAVLAKTERILTNFYDRVADLRAKSANMSPFDVYEVLGIAGTSMEDALSFDVMRWLVQRIPRNLEIVWDDYDEDRALDATLPRFIPLIEEDGDVEANIPWRRWLNAAKGRQSELQWLIERFEKLDCSPREKVELYGSLRLPIRWRIENLPLSRTRNRWPTRSFYYHTEPLITRSQVSLEKELAKPAPPMKKVPLAEGRRVIDKIQEVMLVRYRELYGTTLGDPLSVVRADVGRGTTIFLWGLPPDRRLPLRAYIAGFTIKNGVPINYIEAIGLCEWIEVGFNTFYTFRGGETAWIYGQVLRCLHRHMGAKVISVYPYQIGDGNDEAIESGAFWFYRKLGFRPGRNDLQELCEREERRIAQTPGYKTSPRTLRQLAKAHVFYELANTENGAWDRFSTRNLGLRVNQHMAQEFAGDSARIRQFMSKKLSRALNLSTANWSPAQQNALSNWSLVLGMIPDLPHWTSPEKTQLVKIIRAKAAPDEMAFLRMTQQHPRLRKELLRLGS
ncbi:MAG TPA: hypothetical protein VF753_15665 [Terriglobales bacterium]